MRAEARALLGPAVFTALMVALLATLGVWQLRRLAWKEGLIARYDARVHAEPVATPARADWPSLRAEDYDFRHVRATGRFDLAREALIYSPPPQGAGVEPGYRVVAPFALDGGGFVLVDRGFLPISKRESEARRREPAGRTTIAGVLRSPQARNPFTPADEPQAGLFYTSDANAIAAALKVEDAAPFTLELDPPDRAPRASDDLPLAQGANVELVNNHLSYAVTWFALAAATLGGFGFYAWSRLARS
jgi:surfeit locus 1 family protein